MNKRLTKKKKQELLLKILANKVSELDEDGGKYKARKLHKSFSELKTINRINGYRIEIRPREEKHNYAHFHVVKGSDGMASIRIDTLEVLESSLPETILKRIIVWTQNNKQILMETWNEFHEYRVIVE